jgi:hypothetical protein
MGGVPFGLRIFGLREAVQRELYIFTQGVCKQGSGKVSAESSVLFNLSGMLR